MKTKMPTFAAGMVALSTLLLCAFTARAGEIVVGKEVSHSGSKLLMPGIFSDHMVLQRRVKIPLWGQVAPGETVSVKFEKQTHSVVAGPDGRWMMRLNEHEAGGPFTLVVQDAKTTLTFTDVLVGEVWFGSGQSNMEWAIDGHPKAGKKSACDAATQKLMGDGNHPQIRVSALTRDLLKTPGGGWVVMTSQNRGIMPALMTCCALELQQKLHIPIGIIVRCESSSPSGIWLGRDAVDRDAAIQKQIAAYEKAYPALFATYQAGLAAWKKDPRKFRKPVEPPKPRMCIQYGGPNTDVYGRGYSTRIKPVIPYAIRGFVWDQGENGTGIGGAGQFEVMQALIGQWRQEWGLGTLPFIYVRKNQYPEGFAEQMKTIPQTAMADNRGLRQDVHPQDKAAYARRVVEQMMRLAYAARENNRL